MDAPQPPNPSTPAPPTTSTTSNDISMTDSPPKYVPQFSAATEMILKRINSGLGSSNLSSIGITGTPPGYEDMRRNVLMGMKTSMNMEIPSPPVNTNRRSTGGKARLSSAGQRSGSSTAVGSPATGRQNSGTSASGGAGKGRRKGTKAGQKRKRARDDSESSSDSAAMSGLGDDSESDDAGSVTELPKMTQSGRTVVKPTQFVPAVSEGPTRKRGPTKRAQEHALCKRCGRGHSPANNMIVFCDGCNLGWHQMCHDPAVSDEMVKDESAPWFCADCSLKRGRKGAGSEQGRGVSWQGRSTEEKRSYFSSLSHQQLVSLLLQACVLYPNLPIFPATPNSHPTSAQLPPSGPSRSSSSQPSSQVDRRTNVHPQQPFPPPATAGLFSRAEANPNAPINFIRKIPPGGQGTPKGTPQPESKQSSSAPPAIHVSEDAADGDSRESTPASPPYPRPGNGLMAKLGPDDEDMEWLVDEGDFEAFSHVVYEEDGGGGGGA